MKLSIVVMSILTTCSLLDHCDILHRSANIPDPASDHFLLPVEASYCSWTGTYHRRKRAGAMHSVLCHTVDLSSFYSVQSMLLFVQC